jgi:hypothetical protein
VLKDASLDHVRRGVRNRRRNPRGRHRGPIARRLVVALLVATGTAAVAFLADSQPPVEAATPLVVTPGFAAYAPASGGSALSTSFVVNGLVSGGDGTVGSVTVSSNPASGTATIERASSASGSTFTLVYTPAATTSGEQVVGIDACDTASPADCATGTVTLAPPTVTTVIFDCPSPLTGTGTQTVGVALRAPSTAAPDTTFWSAQAAEPTAVPSSETCNGTTVTVNSLSFVATIVPVPAGASYVAGTATLVGGDSTTDADTTLLYCTGSTTPAATVPAGAAGTCDAQSGTTSYPSSGTDASSWQTTTPYFELETSGSYSPGTVITEPTVSAEFTATGSTGTAITPALTQFTSTVSATAYGFTQTSTVYGAPETTTPFGSTTVANPPGEPTITAVTPGSSQLTVSFTAPSSDGGSQITSYGVSCAPPSGAATTVTDTDVAAASLSAVVSGLSDGTTYACTVTATNAAGTGSPSPSVSGTPTASPPTVTGLSPSSGPTTGGTMVTISGTGFTGATAVRFGSTPATSYTVDSATSIAATSPATTAAGTVDVVVTTPSGTSATSSADEFTYQPPAGTSGSAGGTTSSGGTSSGTGGSSGAGGSSTTAGTEPPPPPPIPVAVLPTQPSAPTAVTATAANGAISVTWRAPTSTPASAYLIGLEPSCSSCRGLVVPGRETTAVVVGVANGRPLQVFVVAVSAQGILGRPSASVTVVPNGDAGCPDAADGLWLLAWNGTITAAGGAPDPVVGSLPRADLTAAAIGLVPAPGCAGAWVASANGGVFALGDAPFLGAAGGVSASDPVVAMASTDNGSGYWLARRDGTVTAFGTAPDLARSGPPPPTATGPIVAIVADPAGEGYWLVTAGGAVAGYGDAASLGSLTADRLTPAAPIVAMAATPDGRGYWLLGADGAVYAFGDATYDGGPNVGEPPARWTAIVASDRGGYDTVDAAGRVVGYGLAASPASVTTGSIVWAAAGA